MMENEITDLLADPERFLGQRVNVSAVLVIRGRECYLVSDGATVDATQRIELYVPGLEEGLDRIVGGWVGGPASYFDRVTLSGVLHPGTARRSPLSLTDVESLVLSRDGETYAVPFTGSG